MKKKIWFCLRKQYFSKNENLDFEDEIFHFILNKIIFIIINLVSICLIFENKKKNAKSFKNFTKFLILNKIFHFLESTKWSSRIIARYQITKEKFESCSQDFRSISFQSRCFRKRQIQSTNQRNTSTWQAFVWY